MAVGGVNLGIAKFHHSMCFGADRSKKDLTIV